MFTTFYRNIKPFKTIFEGPDSNACLSSPDGIQFTFSYKKKTFEVEGNLIGKDVDYFYNNVDHLVVYERSFNESSGFLWISDAIELLNMSDNNGFLRIDINEQVKIYYRNIRTFKEELQKHSIRNLKIDDHNNYFYIDDHEYYIGPSLQVQGLSLFEILNDPEKISVCEFSVENGKKWIQCMYIEDYYKSPF